MQALLRKAQQLPRLFEGDKVAANRVMGCTAQVWATAALDPHGRVQFGGDSDSELTRGLCALLVQGLSGLTPEEVLQVRPQQHTMDAHVHIWLWAAGVWTASRGGGAGACTTAPGDPHSHLGQHTCMRRGLYVLTPQG